jgi:hypothetical protein
MPPTPIEEEREDFDIAEIARQATRQAYEKARQGGLRLLKAKDGNLVEVTADGRERQLRVLRKTEKIAVGTIFSLRTSKK